jgi:hypothetical protein
MLFHISIAADHPAATAAALAEIMGGVAIPFPFVGEGSWVALAGDDRGTFVEVYAKGWRLEPGEGAEPARDLFAAGEGGFTPFHAALATALSETEVHEVARRQGWRSVTCRRGGRFGVIELWIDNQVMLELLTPAMQAEYLAATTGAGWAAMMEAARPALAG